MAAGLFVYKKIQGSRENKKSLNPWKKTRKD
jgi:hypothetical protein